MRREQWLRIDGKGGLPLGQMPILRVCDLDRSVGLHARGRPSLLSPLPPSNNAAQISDAMVCQANSSTTLREPAERILTVAPALGRGKSAGLEY
jgi:hypothetical protein